MEKVSCTARRHWLATPRKHNCHVNNSDVLSAGMGNAAALATSVMNFRRGLRPKSKTAWGHPTYRHDAPLEMPDRSRAERLRLRAAGAQAGAARARDDRPARGGGAEVGEDTGGVVRGSDRTVVQTHALV